MSKATAILMGILCFICGLIIGYIVLPSKKGVVIGNNNDVNPSMRGAIIGCNNKAYEISKQV